MSAIFFLTDLPSNIAEPTLRKLLCDDLAVSVSFRDSPAGTVAMVEARNAQEAQRAAGTLAQTMTLGGGSSYRGGAGYFGRPATAADLCLQRGT